MRRLVLLVPALALGGCTRATPDVVTGDPPPKPIPSSPPTPSTTPSTTSTPTTAPPPGPPPVVMKDVKGNETCEPVIRCGFWSNCITLERVDATRWRSTDYDYKGQIFVRRHDCYAPGGGSTQCAIFCNGVDAGPPCVDGLHPESEACDESAPPSPYKGSRCLEGDGTCGSLM